MFDIQEYEALRAGRAFVELTNWTTIVATGGDRLRFLHSFCTNDVKQLAEGQSVEAFITDVKGKTIGQVWVLSLPTEAVLVGPPGQGPRLVAHLDKYIIREDVQVVDVSAERTWLLTTRRDVPGLTRIDCRLLGTIPAGLVAATERERLLQNGLVAGGEMTLETLRIEAGLPLLGVDFDAQTLPQEVGRDSQAISFTKGCYLGQETVARIDALGHVNQRIVGVRLDSDQLPAAGVELMQNGKVVGRVTSVAFSPRAGATLGLAMVRREHTSAGSRFESNVGAWEVVRLPLE
jgi:folate-binding protein YgfZ